ncbi:MULTISPECIES: hypothetical protein [unclassified Carboxylicivirga]|uniref:hypothetical protein n=1 Tax=Carboxylicivirga TaxID=1628153 RepID=UPI003D33B5D1
MRKLSFFALFFVCLSLLSCEQIIEDIIDDALYNARCEVVDQSDMRRLSSNRSQLDVSIRNKGSRAACDVRLCATLSKDGEIIEKQYAYISYLSSRSTEKVTLTFYRLFYGNEYDHLDLDLQYSEVDPYDYDDEEW